jgi:AcrR family transcriptional regulator
MTPTARSSGALRTRSDAAVADVLAAGRSLFGTRGYEAVTTDEVAAAAGRTKGTIYHHFSTKAALFEAVFVAEQRRLAEVAAGAAARRRDPVAALEAGFAAYLDAVADPVATRLTLLDAPLVLGWARWRACDGSPLRALLVAGLEQVRAAGRLRRGIDVAPLADLLLGAVGEAALRMAHEPDPPSGVRVWRRQVRLLVAGTTTTA